MEKGNFLTIWFNGHKYWADVEYIGNDKKGNKKLESCTYGDIYLLSKDLGTITVNGKDYAVDSIC